MYPRTHVSYLKYRFVLEVVCAGMRAIVFGPMISIRTFEAFYIFVFIWTFRIFFAGKVGDWKLHFTESENTEFDEQMKQQIVDASMFKFEYDSHSNKVTSKL